MRTRRRGNSNKRWLKRNAYTLIRAQLRICLLQWSVCLSVCLSV